MALAKRSFASNNVLRGSRTIFSVTGSLLDENGEALRDAGVRDDGCIIRFEYRLDSLMLTVVGREQSRNEKEGEYRPRTMLSNHTKD
jgi:hypothetical protein